MWGSGAWAKTQWGGVVGTVGPPEVCLPTMLGVVALVSTLAATGIVSAVAVDGGVSAVKVGLYTSSISKIGTCLPDG